MRAKIFEFGRRAASKYSPFPSLKRTFNRNFVLGLAAGGTSVWLYYNYRNIVSFTSTFHRLDDPSLDIVEKLKRAQNIQSSIKKLEESKDSITEEIKKLFTAAGIENPKMKIALEGITIILPTLIKQGAYKTNDFTNDKVLIELSKYCQGNRIEASGNHNKVSVPDVIKTFETLIKAIDKSFNDKLVTLPQQRVEFIKAYHFMADVVSDHILSNSKGDNNRLDEARHILKNLYIHIKSLCTDLPDPSDNSVSNNIQAKDISDKLRELDQELPGIVARTYYILGKECFSGDRANKRERADYAKKSFETANILSEVAEMGSSDATMEAMLSRRNGLLYLKMNDAEDLSDKESLNQDEKKKLQDLLKEIKAGYRQLQGDSRKFYDVSTQTIHRLDKDVLHYSECALQIAAACTLETKYHIKYDNREAAKESAAEAMKVLSESHITFAPLNTPLFDNDKRKKVYLNQIAKLAEIVAPGISSSEWQKLCEDNLYTLPDTIDSAQYLWSTNLKNRIASQPPVVAAGEIYSQVIRFSPKAKNGIPIPDRAYQEAKQGLGRTQAAETVKHAGDYSNIKAREVEMEYWLDYAEVGFKHLLELRLENVGITNNIKILNSVTIGDLKSQSLLDSITASLHIIANDRDIENILIPMSIFQSEGIYHRVALAIKIQADHSLEINYLDSENRPLRKDIEQGFISQLQRLNQNYKISYQQIQVEQQRYNNCSPEVIENIVAYLTGSRVTQEQAVPLHSLLYQAQLTTNQPLDIKQAIEEIKVADLAYSIPSSITGMFAAISNEQAWSNLQHISKPELASELLIATTYDTACTIQFSSVLAGTPAQIYLPMILANTEQAQGYGDREVGEALTTYTLGTWRDNTEQANSQQESIPGSGSDLRQLLKDGLNWGNRQLDTYFKQMFGVSEYEELQALADKYNIGIKVTDKNSAQKSYRKIALQTHTDKAQDNIEEKQRDFIRAKALSEVDSAVTDKEIYSPIMAGLDKIHSGIRLAGSLVDTIKLINDPSQNNIIKTAIGYGYLAETITGHSVGIKYLASLNIGYQLYQGEYGEAASSAAKMAGYMLPGMLMAPAPALAVTLKAGFIAYDAYYTATELYGEIGNLWDQEIP
jgi:hypothetical protein